ncbi:MAG: hypothetical protein J5507_00065 [Clostridia bacterium]|nr:hypothetical protein [Clostridia bacterium]
MADLNVKFKQILSELEENIKNQEDLEFIKTEMFKLYNLFFDEMTRVEEMAYTRMETIAGSQAALEEKVENLENKLSSIEKELFIDDEESDFSITCPYCNNEFIADYDKLKDEIVCPECNNVIELDWGDKIDEPEGCNGNCSGCKLHEDEDEDM